MIDPILSLAHSMHTNKGAYALLLGSGVSRSAEIPTGWEIVLDLVTKIAAMQGEDCSSDPADWYFKKFRHEPQYSILLDDIAKSREERQRLLADYFEPNDDDRSEGRKLPTAGHKAIARLVVSGYVRVIVTTNFDRLIERAIEDEGITPVVLSTTDALSGALPLVHQRCCIIKLHGDYLDTRIKNTPAELAKYDRPVAAMLDRILDDFGLVVCGWSAQWDTSLRAAIERCKSRRFTTYWAARENVTAEAQRLIDLRCAVPISIKDSDTFFQDLADKVAAIDDLNQPHPLSVAAAVATTKRLVANAANHIRFHDFAQQELERTYVDLQSSFEALHDQGDQVAKITKALGEFNTKIEILRAVATTAAYWGQSHYEPIISAIAPRLAVDPKEGQSGIHLNDSLRCIPSLMLLYSAGLAAMASRNISMLAAILTKGFRTHMGERQPYLVSIPWEELQQFFKVLEDHKSQWLPANEWFLRNCRPALKTLIPVTTEYERVFDMFEVVRSLVHIDLEHRGHDLSERTELWGPLGRFAWKSVSGGRHENYLQTVQNDRPLVSELLAAGLFGGSLGTFESVVEQFAMNVANRSARMNW